ncbi:MAG: 4Fe-4S binding protein [Planctomycetota bacterium]
MIQLKRRWVQTLSLLALHSSWGPELKWLCNPVLSCHSCVLAWFACPLGIFVHYAGWQTFPWLAAGTVLLLGVLAGRLLCGWVCPFGFLQDLLHKIPGRKFSLPGWASYVKYFVLLFGIFLFPLWWGESTLLSFCRFCPSSALQVTVPRLLGGGTIEAITAAKLGVLGAVLLLVVFSERGFCKLLCPMGALLAPLNFVSFWRVKVPDPECLACQLCDKACPTDVQPSLRIAAAVPPSRALDCIVCHQCQPICPQQHPEVSPRLAKALRRRGKIGKEE